MTSDLIFPSSNNNYQFLYPHVFLVDMELLQLWGNNVFKFHWFILLQDDITKMIIRAKIILCIKFILIMF